MSRTTGANGRLGNQIIRNIAVSLIAEKFDLYVDYSSKEIINNLGIPLYCGSRKLLTTIELNDDNYMRILNAERLDSNLNSDRAYFQTKPIMELIYNYLRSDKVMNLVKNRNEYKDLYGNNDSVYIHVRMGDVSQHNPGAEYYINALRMIEADRYVDTVYVSSDSPDHEIIQTIKRAHPNVRVLNINEEYTIKYGSVQRSVIMSHGTYSMIIGYIGYESESYYYPLYNSSVKWYADLKREEWKSV